jgi:hypothetical protein
MQSRYFSSIKEILRSWRWDTSSNLLNRWGSSTTFLLIKSVILWCRLLSPLASLRLLYCGIVTSHHPSPSSLNLSYVFDRFLRRKQNIGPLRFLPRSILGKRKTLLSRESSDLLCSLETLFLYMLDILGAFLWYSRHLTGRRDSFLGLLMLHGLATRGPIK